MISRAAWLLPSKARRATVGSQGRPRLHSTHVVPSSNSLWFAPGTPNISAAAHMTWASCFPKQQPANRHVHMVQHCGGAAWQLPLPLPARNPGRQVAVAFRHTSSEVALRSLPQPQDWLRAGATPEPQTRSAPRPPPRPEAPPGLAGQVQMGCGPSIPRRKVSKEQNRAFASPVACRACQLAAPGSAGSPESPGGAPTRRRRRRRRRRRVPAKGSRWSSSSSIRAVSISTATGRDRAAQLQQRRRRAAGVPGT